MQHGRLELPTAAFGDVHLAKPCEDLATDALPSGVLTPGDDLWLSSPFSPFGEETDVLPPRPSCQEMEDLTPLEQLFDLFLFLICGRFDCDEGVLLLVADLGAR